MYQNIILLYQKEGENMKINEILELTTQIKAIINSLENSREKSILLTKLEDLQIYCESYVPRLENK